MTTPDFYHESLLASNGLGIVIAVVVAVFHVKAQLLLKFNFHGCRRYWGRCGSGSVFLGGLAVV